MGILIRAAVLIVLTLAPVSARAQALSPFEQQLLDLSGYFGTMHHLVQICENDNVQVWRDSMLELLRLEDPGRDQRNRMSRRFNDAYNEVEQRFPSCSGEARVYARELARNGSTLSSSMAQSLR